MNGDYAISGKCRILLYCHFLHYYCIAVIFLRKSPCGIELTPFMDYVALKSHLQSESSLTCLPTVWAVGSSTHVYLRHATVSVCVVCQEEEEEALLCHRLSQPHSSIIISRIIFIFFPFQCAALAPSRTTGHEEHGDKTAVCTCGSGEIQWGKKVFSQPPIVQVLPLKKMREACNFHHRYTSTMTDTMRKKIQKITL